MKHWLLSFVAVFALVLPAAAQLQELGDGGPGPVKGQHLTAELVTLAPGIAPGGTQTVGLVLTLEEHWHVYWINAGDSGQPPAIKWTLPTGLTAGPLQFGAPSRLPLGPLMDFGYEDTAVFPVTVSAAANTPNGPAKLDAKVSWLVCRETCIPGKAHLGLTLNVAPGAVQGPLVGALGQAVNDLPQPLPAGAKLSVVADAKNLQLTFDMGKPEGDAEFYPYDSDQILNATEQAVDKLPNGVRLLVPRAPADPTATTKPSNTLKGIVKFSDTDYYEVSAPIVPGTVAVFEDAEAKPGQEKGAHAATEVTTLGAIGLAFLGGIILNLMPCVFPVLFLKGLALVQSSGEERKRMRGHGLVYTLGILVSFWVIVGVLLALRAGGSKAGWGFQLQSPVFIAVLASFLFFFALSLAGQFDLGLTLTSAGGELAKKEGYAGSFFTGVLATIVATPCTAPLMGAAIGFALAQPPLITFAVFTSLALGLALPYLLLTLEPSWTKILPRPGAWMETLKQLTAVPLFATVIWLASVYGRLFTSDSGAGSDHLARLLLGFLVLAIAGWALGKWPARLGSTIAAVLLCGSALAIPLTNAKQEVQIWQPYSETALDVARAAGHPVFIDFTAAWCLSCQVNERLVLKSDDVKKQLAAKNFVLLRADWTQYDEGITRELALVGRSGVPTYVVYPGKTGSAADVLPELLTKGVVLEAIAQQGK